MNPYTNPKETIKGLIGSNPKWRGNCPFCGNKNTFVINSLNGELLYYCFHSSCRIKGKTDVTISLDILRRDGYNIPNSNRLTYREHRVPSYYNIPEVFTGAIQNNDCYKFLTRTRLLDYLDKNVERIKYDPIQHRCVFILKDYDDNILGAIGRSLNYKFPRWYIYARQDTCPFIPHLDIRDGGCLLVEDCISAIIASRISNCIALLGTNISTAIYKYLYNFNELFIALDDDATGKALKLQKQLNLFRPTKIIPLRKDLKYFSNVELQALKDTL